jgi:Fuc2NAc and GlcNAc transferase
MIEIAVFVLALILTYGVRQFALKRALVDIPNERSSHAVPTPHGGGIAIIAAFYIGLTWFFINGTLDMQLFGALLCALPVAAISLIDDIRPLSARVRLLVQAGSAVTALYFLGGIQIVHFGWFELSGIWLNSFALVTIIWLTNLYNFIDGIDGYAGSEAIFVGLAGYLLTGSEVGLLIASAAAGFLVFNWHKASIFMGDVGSAPLGFIFAVLALQDAAEPSFLVWVVLLSLFWFDATVTLVRRYANKEKLSQAHKKHMYQRLNQAGFSHDRVVLLGMALNLILFALLWFVEEENIFWVFIVTLLLQWVAMKYVDSKKAFE